MVEQSPRPLEGIPCARGGELDTLLERQRGTEAQLAQLAAGLADARADIGKLFQEVKALTESKPRLDIEIWKQLNEAGRAEEQVLAQAAAERIGEAAGPQRRVTTDATDTSQAIDTSQATPADSPSVRRARVRVVTPDSEIPSLFSARRMTSTSSVSAASAWGGDSPPTNTSRNSRKRHTDRQLVERKLNDIEELRREMANEAPDDFAEAAREWKGTFRGRLLKLALSPTLQMVSVVLSFSVIVPVWISLDVGHDTQIGYLAKVFQRILCIFFMMEALLYLVAIPKLWRQWTYVLEIIVIFTVCVVDVVAETPAADVLLLIRGIRLPRVFGWLIDKYSDSPQVRTVLVLTASLKQALFTFCWVLLLLLIIFFMAGSVFRAILLSKLEFNEGVFGDVIDAHFSSVHESILTLMEVFVGALDHSEDVFRPLISDGVNSGALVFALTWIMYQTVMQLYFANIATGLFVELIFRSGENVDAGRKKSKGPLNIIQIEAVFNMIDTESTGFITIVDLESHLEENTQCHNILGIVEDPTEKRGGMGSGLDDFLRSVDDCGMGVISISDFVHAVLKHKFGSRTVDQLVFNHQVVRLVKKCNHTNQVVTDVLAVVRHYSDRFDTFAKVLADVRHGVVGELQTLKGDSQQLVGKVSSICQILGVLPDDGPRLPPRVVHSIRGIREAKEVSALMASVKEKLGAALQASGAPGAAQAAADGPHRAPAGGREERGSAAPRWATSQQLLSPVRGGGAPASSRMVRGTAMPSSEAFALSEVAAAAAPTGRSAGPSPVVQPDAPELNLDGEVEHQSSDFELVCNRRTR